jgi:large subunit ribosomal protein L3
MSAKHRERYRVTGILGKKVGMTSVFDAAGNSIPVTIIEAGPCVVLQKRSVEKEGYSALRVAFGDIGAKTTKPETREARRTRAEVGLFKKANQPVRKFVREFRVSAEDAASANVGDEIKVDLFKSGEKVDVSGVSKGRGFAGVFKRHHMAGHVEAHGAHEYFRHPGSIGQRKTPGKVWKNKRLPGHMGVDKVTIQNLKVVDVVPEKNLLLVQGAVPGANGGLLVIRPAVKGPRA